jgi:hypothetical protein
MIMAADGRALENLVATVERLFLPTGFKVEQRERVYDNGTQLAELDIVISGQVGTAGFRWLIECRDRPSEGAASGAWIEQLKARAQIYGFHNVTAVSTTGFSKGAIEVAKRAGVDIRTVTDASAAASPNWLPANFIIHQSDAELIAAAVLLMDNETAENRAAVDARLGATEVTDQTLLRAQKTGARASVLQAFATAVTMHGESIFSDVPENSSEPLRAEFRGCQPDDDRMVIDTDIGPVPVLGFHFTANLRVRTETLPMEALKAYKRQSGALISECAIYPAFELQGVGRVSVELHNVAEGQTSIVLRRHS